MCVHTCTHSEHPVLPWLCTRSKQVEWNNCLVVYNRPLLERALTVSFISQEVSENLQFIILIILVTHAQDSIFEQFSAFGIISVTNSLISNFHVL